MLTVLPPTAQDIMVWCGRGVTVSLPTGPFTTPLCVAEGTRIGLVARRKGFVDVHFEATVAADNLPVSLEDFPADAWHKNIRPDDFRVVDSHDATLLDDAVVKIDDDKWVRPARQLAAVEITVRAHGYDTLSRRCDLTLPSPYIIKLSRKETTARLPIMLANGRVGHVTIKGVDVSTASPQLDGYVICDGRLQLRPPGVPQESDRVVLPSVEGATVPHPSGGMSPAMTFACGFLTAVIMACVGALVYFLLIN